MPHILHEAWSFDRSQNTVDSIGQELEWRTQGILRSWALRLFQTVEVLHFVVVLPMKTKLTLLRKS